VSKLFGYQFTVEFMPGKQNTTVDALSHHDEGPTVLALSLPKFHFFDQFRLEATTLPEVVAKHAEIAAGTTDLKWAIVDDMVVHGRRLFVPPTAMVWPLLLEHAHGMGHEEQQQQQPSLLVPSKLG
jgi:hypothetical protein